jgi:hypothetical protein
MKTIHYLKIHHFKVFGQPITIKLDQPSVLIGPNNSGKTTVIQALALWHLGMTKWYQEKLSGNNGSSVGLNRLEIPPLPISHTRYFWQNLTIRDKNKPITISIGVGVAFQGKVEECTLNFKYSSPEVVYCKPDEKTAQNKKLLNYINNLEVDLLYPISGIVTEEPLIQAGRIHVLIGEGKTSEVLRNFCYQVLENDEKNNTNDWQTVDLAVVYWKKYELENYFIIPEVIEKFFKAYYEQHEQRFNSSIIARKMALLKKAINQTILTDILNNDNDAYAAYLKLDKALQRQTFINNASNKKLSAFLDKVLHQFAHLAHEPLLLNKGQYDKLIKFLPHQALDSEVTEKLDLLIKYLM